MSDYDNVSLVDEIMADVSRALDPADERDWDQRIRSHEGGTFFHSSAWASVLRDSYGHRPVYLLRRGEETCALPLMEVESGLTGKRGVSLPFTDECLPLASTPEQARGLVQEAIEMGRGRRWRFFGSQGGGGLFPEIAAGPASYYGHTVDLRRNALELYGSFAESTQRAIRKAERSGVKVEMGRDIESLKSYYQLHCRTRKRLGVPPQPWVFFQSIHQHVLVRKLGFVLLARYQGRAVAGAIFFHFGGHSVFKFGASDQAHQSLRPNNSILWEAIQRLADLGCTTLHLGRTSTSNEGLRRFKLGWGSAEHRTWYLQYDYQAGSFVQNVDKAHGWHNHIFRHAPIWFSRAVGAWLYRHWT